MYKDFSERIELLKFHIGKYNGCPPMTWLMKEVDSIERYVKFYHHFGLLEDMELEALENKLRKVVHDACSSAKG